MTNDMVRVVLRVVRLKRVCTDFIGSILPFPPSDEGIPVLRADVEGDDALLFIASLDPAEAAPAGRVLVLRVWFMVG